MDDFTELPAPGFRDIESAARRIEPCVLNTPVLHDTELDRALGCEAWLKCENRQTTGSFKLRGASNAVALLREADDPRDVATHSSGNHGAALALAASRDRRRAFVVMPDNSVPSKIDAVRAQGGEAILCEPTQAAREAGLARLVASGLVPIPPYEHPAIIAGQGTVALELIAARPDIDVLLAPVGGGGLLAGCAIAARALLPSATILGAEPAGAADTCASLRRGERVSSWQPDTIADGLRALIGNLNFRIIRELADDVLLVSEEAIVDAMRLVWRCLAMPIEPSSAVAIAAMQAHPDRFKGARVGVIVTGGNVDLDRFPWLRDPAHG